MLLRNDTTSKNEAIIKYFCIQTLGRGILFISGLILFLDFQGIRIMFVLSLSLKLGIFPGHFWVPSVIRSINLVPIAIILTWQKAPLFALLCLSRLTSFILVLGGLSALVGSLIGNNSSNIRRILGASSITHTGWTVVGVISGSFWVYFFLYCVVFIIIIYQIITLNIFAYFTLLSLSGLPPFIMFVGKWNVISSRILLYGGKVLILPILGSFLRLIFYLKFRYAYYLNNSNVGQGVCGVSILNFAGIIYLFLFFDVRLRR